MGTKLKPRAFEISPRCRRVCTLNAGNMPGRSGELIHGWFEAGDNNATIHKKAEMIGVKISEGAIGRHRANHLIPVDTMEDLVMDGDGQGAPKRLTELEVLDLIIDKGARSVQFKTAQISPEMTIRAMELKFKLTQGSAFESFLSALGESMEEPAPPEAGEAVAEPTEDVPEEGPPAPAVGE